MQSMKSIFAKIAALALVLVTTAGLYAGVSLIPIVNYSGTKATVDLYIDNANDALYSYRININTPDGYATDLQSCTVDPKGTGYVVYEDAWSLDKGNLNLYRQASAGETAIKKPTDGKPWLLAQAVYATSDGSAAAEHPFTVSFDQKKTNYKTTTATSKIEYFEISGSVIVNTKTMTDPNFSFDEDEEKVIGVADMLNSVSIFVDGQFKTYTTNLDSHVVFSEATVDDEKVDATISADGKKLTLKGQKDYYTTENEEFTVTFKSVEKGNSDLATPQDFTFFINSVDDPAVGVLISYSNPIAERDGDIKSELFKVKFTDPDGSDYKVSYSLYTCSRKVTSVADLQQAVTAGEARSFASKECQLDEEDTVNCMSPVFDCDAVAHPAKSAGYYYYITSKESGKTEPIGLSEAYAVTVNDTDRVSTHTTKAIAKDGTTIKSNSTITIIPSTDCVDADSDTITPKYKWYINQKVFVSWNDMSTVTPTYGQIKPGDSLVAEVTYETTPYNDGNSVVDATKDTISFDIENTAPVCSDTTPQEYFIRKGEATSKTFQVKFFDPDAQAWSLDSVSSTAQKGSVECTFIGNDLKGNLTVTVKYTVTDLKTEFTTPDVFTVNITDAKGGQGVSGTITIDYRENPGPVVVQKGEVAASYNEVDENLEAVVVDLNVTFQDKDQPVAGTGVKSVKWNVELVDGTTSTKFDGSMVKDNFAPVAGSALCDVTGKLTLGYDIVAQLKEGAARTKEIALKVTAVATDNDGAAGDAATWQFKVVDVLQKPKAPVNCTMTFTDLDEEESATLRARYGVTVHVDSYDKLSPDNDPVTLGYNYYVDEVWKSNKSTTEYEWKVSKSITDSTNKKNCVVYATCAANASASYNKLIVVTSDRIVSSKVTVKNTPVDIEAVDEPLRRINRGEICFGESQVDDTVKEFAIFFAGQNQPSGRADIQSVANVYDTDVVDQIDTLTYSIDYSAATDYIKSAEIIKNLEGNGAILKIYTLAHANTDDIQLAINLPYIKASVSDGEYTDSVDLKLDIADVNNVPEFFTANTIPLMLDDMGKYKDIDITIITSVGGYGFENSQEIESADVKNIVESDPKAPILNPYFGGGIQVKSIVPVVDKPGYYAITLTCYMTASIEERMANSAEFTLGITDSGKAFPGSKDPTIGNYAEMTFKLVLNPSPWYPFFDLTCDHGEESEDVKHIVTFTDKNGNVGARIEVTGSHIVPADFYGKSDGLLSGVEYTVTARVVGADEDCDLTKNSVTPVYTAPKKPAVNNEEPYVADEANIFELDFEISMASAYEITVSDGQVLYGTFEPDDNDLIMSKAIQSICFAEPGDYTVTIRGTNPSYLTGTEETTITVTVNNSIKPQAGWDYSKFVPGDGDVQLTGDINFSWSNYQGATEYTIVLLDDTNEEVGRKTVAGTSFMVQDIVPGTYTWYVIPNNAKNSPSALQTFTVLDTNSNIPLVKEVIVDEKSIKFVCYEADQDIDLNNLSAKIYYYSDANDWFIGTVKLTYSQNDDGQTYSLTGEFNKDPKVQDGHYIMVDFFIGQKKQNDNLLLYKVTVED